MALAIRLAVLGSPVLAVRLGIVGRLSIVGRLPSGTSNENCNGLEWCTPQKSCNRGVYCTRHLAWSLRES